jgi:hypothetical protein
MAGALVGVLVGLARCKPENRARAERTVALLASFLVGGMVGVAVCMIGVSCQLRYDGAQIIVDGKEKWVEPPGGDPQGWVRVWFFGHQVHEATGPREEMIVWDRRLFWFLLIGFITGGAFLGTLLSWLARRQTRNKVSTEPGVAADGRPGRQTEL